MGSVLFWYLWILLYRVADAAVEAGKDLRQHDNAAYYFWALNRSDIPKHSSLLELYGDSDDFEDPGYVFPARAVADFQSRAVDLSRARFAARSTRCEYQHIKGPLLSQIFPLTGVRYGAFLIRVSTKLALESGDAELATQGVLDLISLSKHCVVREPAGIEIDGLVSLAVLSMACEQADLLLQTDLANRAQLESINREFDLLVNREDPFGFESAISRMSELGWPVLRAITLEKLETKLNELPPGQVVVTDLSPAIEEGLDNAKAQLELAQSGGDEIVEHWHSPDAEEVMLQVIERGEAGEYGPFGTVYSGYYKMWQTERRELTRVADMRMRLQAEADN